jgi:hypothetical protein
MKLIYYVAILAMGGFIFNGYSQDYKKTGGLARLTGMGANIYVADPFFATINPAWNSVYDNFLMGDLGSSVGTPFSAGGSGQFISANFRLNNNWTVGGLLTRNDFNGLSIALLDPGTNNSLGLPFPGVVSTVNDIVGGGNNVVVPLDNNVELMGTYSFGNTSVGLGVAYASTSNDFTPDTGAISEGSGSQIGFNLGILTNISGNFKVDAGISFAFPSASYKPGIGFETNASQTIILANARGFWKHSSKITVVPVVAFATASGSFETSGSSADLNSFTAFALGLGMNYTVDDFLLAGGILYNTNTLTIPGNVATSTPDLDYGATNFPVWNIGMEWTMLDWLVARLGYVAVSGNATIQTPGTTGVNEFTTSYFLPASRGFTVGVGFRLGDFSIDATINEDVLRQGLNNIGGGGATFAYLSTSYALP